MEQSSAFSVIEPGHPSLSVVRQCELVSISRLETAWKVEVVNCHGPVALLEPLPVGMLRNPLSACPTAATDCTLTPGCCATVSAVEP